MLLTPQLPNSPPFLRTHCTLGTAAGEEEQAEPPTQIISSLLKITTYSSGTLEAQRETQNTSLWLLTAKQSEGSCKLSVTFFSDRFFNGEFIATSTQCLELIKKKPLLHLVLLS